MTKRWFDRASVAWAALACPWVAIKLWVLLGIGYYSAGEFAGDVIVALAFCALLVLAVRWRVLGPVSWLVAGVLYAVGFLVEIAEAVSYYFQASSFNPRFFANVRMDNLRSGLDAFPLLFAVTVTVLVGMAAVAAWLFARQSRLRARDGFLHMVFKAVALVGLAVIAVCVPSAGHRLVGVFSGYDTGLASMDANGASGLVNSNLASRAGARASAGKNLVIIYMESLERIYTDEKIFPGLTPNLDRWRAQGLDYSGYLTFTGADYTMAGLFSSQCGAPFLPSPVRALGLDGNDANATSFQPNLACLGDVLHVAGYEQVFMNGSPLTFADQGTFFRMHGFDQVLGRDELESQNGGNLPSPGWGLYDSDLFRLAKAKFDGLAASGKLFNMDLLTIDDHPERGRPSPGCPSYAANDNSMLQAAHCTDFLVGKFLDDISRSPAWKNTIVVVMSDHQSMRNDAWPLYPASYKRRPLLFILNGGKGERAMRFYHMDIAPTVLHLMGVKTNVTFMAGADRSAPNAPDSPLVNNPEDLAVLRHAIWARAQPLDLCKRGVLVGAAQENGVQISGYTVPMTYNNGRYQVGLSTDQEWRLLVGRQNVKSTIGPASDSAASMQPGANGQLVMSPMADSGPAQQFSVDWIGTHGAHARLADVPRLRGLQIRSPDCAALVAKIDKASANQRFDLRSRFTATTAPTHPDLPTTLRFSDKSSLAFERELGWQPPEVWGSFTFGDVASLGFTLPRENCHAAQADFKVQPFLPKSRPLLDVRVLANGKQMAQWKIKNSGHTWQDVSAPIRTSDPQCRVDLRFEFLRPGAAPPPYPVGEDPRPLQLDFLTMQLVPASSPAHAATAP